MPFRPGPILPRYFLPLLLLAGTGSAGPERGLRPLRSWGPREHEGGAQCFSVLQDRRGVVFVGNLAGVLEFDGISWRLIPLRNDSACLGLAEGQDGTIAASGFDEMGFLVPDPSGLLRYESLLPRVPPDALPVGRVDRVHAVREGLVFQSASRLFLWDAGALRIVPAPEGSRFTRSFALNDVLVVQTPERLYRLMGTSLSPLPGDWSEGRSVHALLPRPGGGILAVVEGVGVVLVDEAGRATRGPQDLAWLGDARVAGGAVLQDGRTALGLRDGGLVILTPTLAVDELIGSESGLPLEVLSSVVAGRDGSLWASYDRGPYQIPASSPYTLFDTRTGLVGQAVSMARLEGALYAGTTSGLFCLLSPEAREDGRKGFRFVPVAGVRESVFGLVAVPPTSSAAPAGLLAGGRDGIREVTGLQSRHLPDTDRLHVYHLVSSAHDPNRVWVGLQDGLAALRRDRDGRWRVEGRVPGSRGLVHTLEETEDGSLLAGTVFDGALHVTFSDPARLQTASVRQVVPGEVNLTRVAGRILAASPKGLLRWEPSSQRLVPDPVLGPLLDGPRLYRIAQDVRGDIWASTPWTLLVRQAGGTYRRDDSRLAGIPGRDVQSIYAEPDGIVWFGTDEGLARYDPAGARGEAEILPALVRRVTLERKGGTVTVWGGYGGGAGSSAGPRLPYGGRLRIECAPGDAAGAGAFRFQYRLDGLDEDWSEPTTEPRREYTNLWEGPYVFRVRARDPFNPRIAPERVFAFQVVPPWWRRSPALAAWALLGLAVVAAYLRLRNRALRHRAELLAERVAQRTRQLASAVQELDHARAELEQRNQELAGANEELKTLSMRDGLTGIPNRRRFDEAFAEEWNRAFRARAPVSLAIVDVDFFKKLNDRRGHQEGDRCLRALAQAMSSVVQRSGDLAARFGGEEFVLLLPGTPPEGAARVAETVRREIEALAMPHPDSPFGVVTASLGVTTAYPHEGGTAEQLLRSADAALYDAKLAGRNRVRQARLRSGPFFTPRSGERKAAG